jgi:hypothetical protein
VAAKWSQTKLRNWVGIYFAREFRREALQYCPYLGGEPVTIGSTVDDPLMIATERSTAYGPAGNKTQAPAMNPRSNSRALLPSKSKMVKISSNPMGEIEEKEEIPLSNDMNLRRHNFVDKGADGVSSRNRAPRVAGQSFRRLRSDRA